MRIPIDDLLIDTNARLSRIADNLEILVEKLTPKEAIEEVTEKVTKAAPTATHDFVWAMYQIRHGLTVKCLADGNFYAAESSGRCDVHFDIRFVPYVITSQWELDPACMNCVDMPEKLKEGTFEWAMQQLKDGKEVTRHDWYDGVGDQGWKIGSAATFRLNEDIDEHDWEIFYMRHDIKWAASQLNAHKKVRRRAWDDDENLEDDFRDIGIEDVFANDWELAEDD